MNEREPQNHLALPLGASVALAALKLWAATLTNSSALLAEGIRSLVDVSSRTLMLNGLSRPAATSPPSSRDADLAFWALVVPVLLYALAAGVSIYEGVDRLNRPRGLAEAPLGYAVLALSLALQAGLAWALRPHAGGPAGLAVAIQTTIGVLCAAVSLAGFAGAHLGGLPDADAVGAIAVGLGLALIAALLAIELRKLLLRLWPAAATADPPPASSALPDATDAAPAALTRRIKRRRR